MVLSTKFVFLFFFLPFCPCFWVSCVIFAVNLIRIYTELGGQASVFWIWFPFLCVCFYEPLFANCKVGESSKLQISCVVQFKSHWYRCQVIVFSMWFPISCVFMWPTFCNIGGSMIKFKRVIWCLVWYIMTKLFRYFSWLASRFVNEVKILQVNEDLLDNSLIHHSHER